VGIPVEEVEEGIEVDVSVELEMDDIFTIFQ
jgi:hypothetical protein